MPALSLTRQTPHQLHFGSSHFIPLMFLLLGGPAAVLMLGFVEGGGAARYVVGGGMALFAVIGVVGVLHRYQLTIDLASRTYRGLRGFWPSPKPMQGSLDDMRGIVLERRWSSRKDSEGRTRRYVTWTLYFDFGNDDKVSFLATTVESQAYAKLEHFSKLLRLPAIDRTTGEERHREHDRLDRSLAERSWSKEEQAGAPEPPPGTGRIDWDPSAGAGSIVLPPLGLSIGRLFTMLLGLAGIVLGTAVVLGQQGMVQLPVKIHGGGWLIAGFFLLFGLGWFFQALTLIRGRQVIREERDGLRFYETTGLGRRRCRRFIPKREIEEIALSGVVDDSTRRLRARRGQKREEVAVRADKRVVRVGHALTAEEQRWLARALKHLAAR